MATKTRRQTQGMVKSPAKALAVLSSPLVMRGLREFPQSSRWQVKQVFREARSQLAISAAGHVAAYSAATRALSQRIEIADAEVSGEARAIAVPDKPFVARPDFPAVFAWNPAGKILAAASGTWQPELHVFDAAAGKFAGRFGAFRVYPTHLCWSESGKYLAVSSDGSQNAKLTLWMAGEKPEDFEPLCEMDRSAAEGNSAEDAEGGEGGNFFGFGAAAFRHDEKLMAAALEFDAEWADDALLLVSVPRLEIRARFETTGQVTQLSWTSDGRAVIFCASGQAYSLEVESGEISSLPFAAEMCRCHPTRPLCAFYNSWLKSSAAGRIFIADLQRHTVMDECRAEEIAEMRWSADGRTLYSAARDGLVYLFDGPFS